MTRIPPSLPYSVLYSLLLFSPLLVLLLLPVPCLGSECILLTLIQLADPSQLEAGGLTGFCAWGLGPLPAAAVIFALGLVGYRLTGKERPRRIHWAATWALFCLSAYVIVWYAIILVTSIGASETPLEEFLAITAVMALTVVTLGQPLIVLWLWLVNRIWNTHIPPAPQSAEAQIQ
jgi:hypothetical protein